MFGGMIVFGLLGLVLAGPIGMLLGLVVGGFLGVRVNKRAQADLRKSFRTPSARMRRRHPRPDRS